MAWLPSPRDDVHRGLWILDLREGSFSPLSSNCQSSLPGICLTQRLSTQRLRRCGLSVTYPIQSLPYASCSSSSLSPTSHAVPAAPRKNRDVYVVICDAVALGVLHQAACLVAFKATSRSSRRKTLPTLVLGSSC